MKNHDPDPVTGIEPGHPPGSSVGSDGDVISDVLRGVQLRGATFFRISAHDPWVSEAPAASEIASIIMPDAQRVIEYHVVTEGTCWANLVEGDTPPMKLSAGSIVVFPQGDPHVFSSEAGMRNPPDIRVYQPPSEGAVLPYILTVGKGESVSADLICGFLGHDEKPFNPLLLALPKIIHIPNGYDTTDGWLGHLIDATVKESTRRGLGSAILLSRLSELLFIEVIRRYTASLPDGSSGWFAALKNPQIGATLRLLHRDPAHAWTITELGRAVGLSRTVLAERFAELVGMPPITYLAQWRMQVAAGLLHNSTHSVARIAEQVGYESEASFSRSFKRVTGISPGQWRKGGNPRSDASSAP